MADDNSSWLLSDLTPEEAQVEQDQHQINAYKQIAERILATERGIIKLVLELGSLQNIVGHDDFFIIYEAITSGERLTEHLGRTKNLESFKRLLQRHFNIKPLSPSEVEFSNELLGEDAQIHQDEEVAFFLDKRSILLLIKALRLSEGLCISDQPFTPLPSEVSGGLQNGEQ